MFLLASSQQMLDLSTAIASRLANLAQTQREDFQQLLSRYAREWLLYRLSLTEHRDRFILKGALLFSYWTGAPHGRLATLISWAMAHPFWKFLQRYSATCAM